MEGWQPPSPAKVDLPQMQRGETLGSKFREWLKLTEGAAEGANRMSRAEYETLLAQQRIRAEVKTDVKIKTDPSPNPNDVF